MPFADQPDLSAESTVRPDVPAGDTTVVVNDFTEPHVDDVIDTPEELLRAAPILVKESKAGYKTTEFWAAIVTSVALVLNAIPMPDSKEGYVVAGLAVAYAIARGIAKAGVPHVEDAVPAPPAD